MKASQAVLSNLAYKILSRSVDDCNGIGCTKVDVDEIEELEIALHIKKQIAKGAKRIQIDICRPPNGDNDE